MPEDTIRVLRILEYTGPRAAVEKQIANSLHGEKTFGPKGQEITIRGATLGLFPEVLEGAKPTHLPSTEGWIPFTGDRRPVPGDTLVKVYFRKGEASNVPRAARYWMWSEVEDYTIIAYKLA